MCYLEKLGHDSWKEKILFKWIFFIYVLALWALQDKCRLVPLYSRGILMTDISKTLWKSLFKKEETKSLLILEQRAVYDKKTHQRPDQHSDTQVGCYCCFYNFGKFIFNILCYSKSQSFVKFSSSHWTFILFSLVMNSHVKSSCAMFCFNMWIFLIHMWTKPETNASGAGVVCH